MNTETITLMSGMVTDKHFERRDKLEQEIEDLKDRL